MTDEEDKLEAQRLVEQLKRDEATNKPQGADWLQQMLPRFALVTQVPGQTPQQVQIIATHYGVGLPSGQVVLFTLGVGTIAILPDWDLIHQLVQAERGRMALVMEESEVKQETATVA